MTEPTKREPVPEPGKRPRRILKEIVREPTAAGIVYRIINGGLEILLFQDAYGRWMVPKGHIEEGETAQETAIREVAEEVGMKQVQPTCWLGKIHFNYRREETLVMITQQVYLLKALGDTDEIAKEEWMQGVAWVRYEDAIKNIQYEEIVKLIKKAKRRLEQRKEI